MSSLPSSTSISATIARAHYASLQRVLNVVDTLPVRSAARITALKYGGGSSASFRRGATGGICTVPGCGPALQWPLPPWWWPRFWLPHVPGCAPEGDAGADGRQHRCR
ncbi:MAG: hypothetical protein WDO73_34025 [Ignavibacteriota bacterium]